MKKPNEIKGLDDRLLVETGVRKKAKPMDRTASFARATPSDNNPPKFSDGD
jgi:hypothetical protein